MNVILIGNAISFTGAVLMVVSGLMTSKQRILLLQCVQFAIMGAGNLILGGVTGMISNAVSIVRNVLCCRVRIDLRMKLFFIALQVGLSLAVGPLTLLGMLPIVSGCVFTWFIDLEDPVRFKQMIIACQLMWLVYDLSLMNLVSAGFDVITLVTNLVAIRSMRCAA